MEPLNLVHFCLSPLEVSYDYKSVAQAVSRERTTKGLPSTWRYRDLLPVDDDVVHIGTGLTPLVKAGNLGQASGVKERLRGVEGTSGRAAADV